MRIIFSNTSFLAVVVSSFTSAVIVPAFSTPAPISFDMKNRYVFTKPDDNSAKVMASLIRASEDGGENGTCEERLDRPEPFGVAESVFLALTLGLLIMVMIVGNILVITAILLERELQRAQYYLVLSLAVADLTVGVVVSPLAALYDINRQWHLGVPMCDFWIVSDVLACTSSILHLLAIALDRYWSITDVTYIQKRTPRRIAVMLLFVWIVSLCVSVAPILGWKDSQFTCRVEVRNECLISQAVGYQIFSTTTAFYGPLVLICILYWKIYKAAKRRIQMQGTDASGQSSSASGMGYHVTSHKLDETTGLGVVSYPKKVTRRSNTVAQLRAKILALQQTQDGSVRRRSTFRKRRTGDQPQQTTVSIPINGRGPSLKGRSQVQIRVIQPSSNEPTTIGVDSDSHGAKNGHLVVYGGVTTSSATSSCCSLNEECSSYGDEASSVSACANDYNASIPYQGGIAASSTAIVTPTPAESTDGPIDAVSNSPNAGSSGLTDEDSDSPADGPDFSTPSPLIAKEKRDSLTVVRARAHSLNSLICKEPLVSKGARGSRHSTVSQTEMTSASHSTGVVNAQKATPATAIVPASSQKRKRTRSKKELAESNRERRAGRTLAIITGIFVVCWVPFFVLALIRPLCGGAKWCPVPEPLDSVFLWLGYVNSAINPIIYTVFSPDFRMAFKRTLARVCFVKRIF